jgi:hypothetical protein
MVALLLLIANLVFFAWQYPQQQLLESRQVAEPAAVQNPGHDDSPAQTLMMLKELPSVVADKIVTVNADKPAVDSRTVGAGAQTVSKETSSEPVCWTLGPFANGRQADRGLTILTAQGIKGRSYERRGSVLAGYRVQLPVQGSKEAAQRTILELRGRGIKDVAMLSDNGNYFVSLGFFSKSESARQRSAAVSKLGYKPLTQKVYREESGYWLDLYSITDRAPLDKAWDSLSAAFPRVQRSIITCP